MHPYQRQIDLCGEALEAVRSSIPPDLFRDVDDYINRFDEWGLGMEVLIDQLGELDIVISPEQFDLIRAAMDSIGQGESDRLAHLRTHGVSRPPESPAS
ncbi:MafI family immunity protein [Aquisphaera insulae]|uniref:MafI family immunity protein n=1 Tax=Aquisphaera insulae TaxID=2712864 RepID=UPI0013ECC6F4|nr:MafI family immunity protein [Aquisphaera insulae]